MMQSKSMKTQKSVFVSSLVFASVAPYVLVPWILASIWPLENLTHHFITYLAIIHMHQLASWFFYMDVDAYRVMKGNKQFFFIYPLLAFAGCGAFFALAPGAAVAPYWVLFTGITFHHFQKQNLGLYVLLTRRFHGLGVSQFERRLLVSGFWVGFLAWKNVYTDVLDPYLPELQLLAASLQAILVVGFGVLLARRVREHGWEHLKTAWPAYLLLLFFVGFFWPAFTLPSGTAFMMFGGAHGVQYLVMMVFVSAGYGQRLSRGFSRPILHGAITVLVICGFLLFTVSFEGLWQWIEDLRVPVTNLSQERFSDFTYGWLSAFALSHYIIDARMWRFSMQDSRDYLRERLAVAF